MGKIVLEDFNEGNGYYKINLAYLNKEQVEEIEAIVSKWKPTDEDIKSCIAMCLTDANEQRFKDYGTNLKDCLAWLEKQGENKPAWSGWNERMCNASIRACQYMAENFENSTQDYEDAIDWLNSLKGRVQPQWKPSEEQMAHLVAAIEESDGNCILQSLYNDLKKL